MKLRKIAILIFTALLGVGMLTSCTQNNSDQKGGVTLTEQEKKVIRKQEEALALFLVNNFEDIKKIEFVSISKGGFGKPRFVDFVINDKISMYTDLSDNYETGHSLGYEKDETMLKEKEEPTHLTDLNSIEVIYVGE